MGDEPFYYVTAKQVYEKLEAHDDVLRDLRRDVRDTRRSEEKAHAELHERLRMLEGHTHGDLTPPKNGGRKREWTLALGLVIGGVVAAILRELGGANVP